MAKGNTKKKVRILSIDGGGIRGILPAVTLEYLEQGLRKALRARITADLPAEDLDNGALETALADVRISDFFDLIAGTSTGGILTCLYLCPDPADERHRTYDAGRIKEFYFEHGPSIFHSSVFSKLRRGFGYTDEKYDVAPMEEVARQYFQDMELSDLVKPCLVTSYDITDRKAVLFTSAEASNNPIKNFKIRDVVRSTSAAPTYFEPSRVFNDLGAPFELIDGGLYANNPALCAYSEARKISFSRFDPEKADHPTAKDMLLVSLGTGSVKMPYDYSEMKDKGAIGWAKPIIDILMSSNSETIAYFLMQIYDTLSESDKEDYYRLEPTLSSAKTDMDDASPENLKNLEYDAKDFISKKDGVIQEVIRKLIDNGSELDRILAQVHKIPAA